MLRFKRFLILLVLALMTGTGFLAQAQGNPLDAPQISVIMARLASIFIRTASSPPQISILARRPFTSACPLHNIRSL